MRVVNCAQLAVNLYSFLSIEMIKIWRKIKTRQKEISPGLVGLDRGSIAATQQRRVSAEYEETKCDAAPSHVLATCLGASPNACQCAAKQAARTPIRAQYKTVSSASLSVS